MTDKCIYIIGRPLVKNFKQGVNYNMVNLSEVMKTDARLKWVNER